MDKKSNIVLEDKRKKYRCNCLCGKTFYACKSIFHEMGILDRGGGSCPYCKKFFNLTVDEENNKMILMDWDEFVKKLEFSKKIGECEIENG